MDMADTVLEYLQSQSHPIHVHIGSDGDPFASLVYRHFMRRAENMSHLSFSIQTNGLLIKQMHHRIKNIFSRLQTLNVSIDGATKHTYELLRQGGSHEKILDNLACIKEIKKQYGFEFILHVVVQKDNYHEMAQMVDLAEQYGADRIWFNRITNWNTHANFAELDVADENNADHPQYLEMRSKIKHRAAGYDQRFIEMPTLVSKTFK
jgi:MoaA/NifB/PqqE/SkfB family radical SAM enzyme